jgi:uncharacterized protein GlcG (DUF336 family)
MADGDYGFDPEITDVDRDEEELIAVAGTQGFAAPDAIRAERISVDGTTLRYTDQDASGLLSVPVNARSFATINGLLGALTAVTGYFSGTLVAGAAYGAEAAGVRAATAAEYANRDVFVLSDGSGVNRFPPRGGTDGDVVATPLTAAETRSLIESAFAVMSRARAQIRQPLNSRAQVSIAVVDTRGENLGLVRSPDAPIFGIDAALQKARSVAFLSGPNAAADLRASQTSAGGPDVNVSDFVGQFQAFLGSAGGLSGAIAFANRSIGNLARPFFPDGEVVRANGPLSRPIAAFSPFSTGLQSALITGNIGQHIGYVTSGGASADSPAQCSNLPRTPGGRNRLANGLQIFPGAVPLYRGAVLVGAIGVSGDGIDQDDMVAFLGANNAGLSVGNAPVAARADQIIVGVGSGVRLRYVNCPFAPFVDSGEANVCDGK